MKRCVCHQISKEVLFYGRWTKTSGSGVGGDSYYADGCGVDEESATLVNNGTHVICHGEFQG